jgi:hypothetical protein
MEHPSASSELCQQCGLCCAGALFSCGHLQPGEITPPRQAAWQQAGVRWQPSDDATHFDLPCAAWQQNRCGCYEQRPQVCAEFRCKLLLRLELGMVDGAEAQRIVKLALNQVAGLGQRLAQPQAWNGGQNLAALPFHKQLRQFREWYAAAAPDTRREFAHLMAEQRMALMLFEMYFYPPQN